MIIRLLAPLATLACAVVLFAGCETGSTLSLIKEPDYIKVPLQDARNLYATLRTIAIDRIFYAQGKCARRELTAAECHQISEDVTTLRKLDWEIRRGLENPKAELDTKKVVKILELSAKIIGALAP